MPSLATQDEIQVYELHKNLLQSWNDRDAGAFADHFAHECICVGFDGTEYTMASEIEAALSEIFRRHPVASYVSKVRSARRVDAATVVLRAVAGMIPPGQMTLRTDRSAIQVMVTCLIEGQWRIVSFQNTPVRFDGRPDDLRALNHELQDLLPKPVPRRAA